MKAAENSLTHVDEALTVAQAERLAFDRFGLAARAERLSGERDQNFRLAGRDGVLYLLKISNSAESPAVTDLQTRALRHIAAVDPALPTPRVLPALDGAHTANWVSAEGRPMVCRLLTFLEGQPLYKVAVTRELLADLGRLLARLHRGLADFSHPAERHELLWDTSRAHHMRERLWAIPDPARRSLAERGFDLFEASALPRLPALPAQVIHNDLNPHNVLATPERVTGLLDFGDAVHAPRIADLAVASAYHIAAQGDALANVAALAAGYHREWPLGHEEVDALIPIIAGRLAMTVVITAWRAARYPQNSDYILRNTPAAWLGLERLTALDAAQTAARLADALT